MKYYLLLFLSLIFLSCDKEEKQTDIITPGVPAANFLKGADISSIPLVRQSGAVVYNEQGEAEDMLVTLKNAGVNTVRIRLFYDPADGHNSLEEVTALAAEARAMGFKIWIALHYSDTWADPGQQIKPAAWQNLDYTGLKQAVYDYTKLVMRELSPEYIQLGNEINSGILLPDGGYNGNPEQLEGILKAGIRAVREEGQASITQIILHYAGYQNAEMFFDAFQYLDYDYIGLSYYPIWHGDDMDGLGHAIASLQAYSNKKVILAETAYPFTLGWNDMTTNIVGSNDQIIPQHYPATPQGQYDYLSDIDATLRDFGCKGFCYWGGELIAYNGSESQNGSPFENQAFWDFDNKALSVLNVYSLSWPRTQ